MAVRPLGGALHQALMRLLYELFIEQPYPGLGFGCKGQAKYIIRV